MEKKKNTIKKLVNSLGGKFSSELGIDLGKGNSVEIFKWFLASKLFGARINTTIAMNTYKEFEKCNVLSPDKIIDTGWDGLVKILDDGGYVRYDFSTATKLLEIMKELLDKYDGDLNQLHLKAHDEKDLESRLKDLGKGIGNVTVNIFLRELRTIWAKANPKPSELVKTAARNLGYIKPGKDALKSLETVWSQHKIPGNDFRDFEAALLRLGKDYCRKKKYDDCPLEADCPCRIKK